MFTIGYLVILSPIGCSLCFLLFNEKDKIFRGKRTKDRVVIIISFSLVGMSPVFQSTLSAARPGRPLQEKLPQPVHHLVKLLFISRGISLPASCTADCGLQAQRNRSCFLARRVARKNLLTVGLVTYW